MSECLSDYDLLVCPFLLSQKKKMSTIEGLLSNLSLGDEPKLVEAVKSQGVVASGLADQIEVLAVKCASTNDAEAIAALTTVKALAEEAPAAEAFTKVCLLAGK